MSDETPSAESPPTDQEEGRIPATTAGEEGPPHGTKLVKTAIAALGIVFGDIGTSPLYALRECFSGQFGLPVEQARVLGVLSLILWSLIIVISTKYLVLVMQADNRGEGGILALMALMRSKGARHGRMEAVLVVLGIFGAALLYGDGMITPAISVLSAVEGLGVATPAFDTYVVPITVSILLALFLFQRHGTARVGSVFGPIIMLWFIVIGGIGVSQIIGTPRVLAALSPTYAAGFLLENSARGFFVLGAVFLVVTGGEALYADMGHFGKRPIRLTWFGIVLPGLLLSYFGQGALLLSDAAAAKNPFYLAAPGWALYPLVGLATAATVIASQAVISGSFSLARQAVHLGYSPRLKIEHTSPDEAGQVYIPSVNWVLLAATVGLVVGFRSSSALAGAYGVAVTTTMVITTILLYVVMRDIWKWSAVLAVPIAAGLLCVDLAFFGANIVKIPNGGWFPLAVAMIIFTLMSTWRRGRQLLARRLYESNVPVEDFLRDLDTDSLARAKGTAVFLTGDANGTPTALLHNIKHNQVLHDCVVLLTVSTAAVPHVPVGERIECDDLGHNFWRIRAHYGFMQSPLVPRLLELASEKGLDFSNTTFFLSRKIPIVTAQPGMAMWREHLFASMSRNSQNVTTYFRLPADRVIEIGTQVEI